jgi:predicted DNA-binding mobile mystery protein A
MINGGEISGRGMKNHSLDRARERLDRRLGSLKPVDRFATPPRGWIRAIRNAVGMTGAQLGKRLGTSPQSVDALERSEAEGSVKLETLRRAAEALDCMLVYALVPRTSLDGEVRRRSRALAVRDLGLVAHSMKLEAQEVGGADLEARIDAYIREHVRLKDLWNHT